MNVLEVRNLFKNYDGVKAVENVSFGIPKGVIAALIGQNGAGKTTVFNIITGFLKPDSGCIIFKNKDITSMAPYQITQRGIGRTFQNIRIFSQLSVLENVMLATKYGHSESLWAALFRGREIRKKDRQNQERAESCLMLVGMHDKKNELAEDLSHGQRKLLELARIIALDPEVFLLDEPSAGLFPETISKMCEIIHQLRDSGKTILFISHDINVVMGLAEKVIALNYGIKIAEGTPSETQNNEAVINAYLGRRRAIAP